MKRLLFLIFLFSCICYNVNAFDFVVNGRIVGDQIFKAAYAYDSNSFEFISKVEIVDGKFVINGKGNVAQRFGALPGVLVILTKENSPPEQISFSQRANHRVSVVLEKTIDLTYNVSNRQFTINGGKDNQTQQAFEDVLSDYRHQRDSSFTEIDKLNLGEGEKHDRKVELATRLFTVSLHKMMPFFVRYRESRVPLQFFSAVIYDNAIPSRIVTEIYDQFPDSIRNSTYGLHLLKDIEDKIQTEEELNRPLYTVGMEMPVFELFDQKSAFIKTSTRYGKYTLIDFWATWCSPCRNETPNLREAYQKYQEKGFRVITISVDQQSDYQTWLKVLQTDKMGAFTNLIDGPKGLTAKAMKINAIPANYLVDENGKIIATNLRGEELGMQLRKLFGND